MSISCEFLTGNVVHWQVVHVGLDELECFVLYVFHGLAVKLLSQVLNLLTRDTLPVFRRLEAFNDDRNHIGETFDALSHA